MEYKKIDNTYILRLDRGEEIISKIKELCLKENISLGKISGLGACDELIIGLYSINDKEFLQKEFKEEMEITSLVGNISTMDDEIYLHMHINVADKELKTYGGHLNKCIISATGEIFIEKIDGNINRKKDKTIGLNLFDFK